MLTFLITLFSKLIVECRTHVLLKNSWPLLWIRSAVIDHINVSRNFAYAWMFVRTTVGYTADTMYLSFFGEENSLMHNDDIVSSDNMKLVDSNLVDCSQNYTAGITQVYIAVSISVSVSIYWHLFLLSDYNWRQDCLQSPLPVLRLLKRRFCGFHATQGRYMVSIKWNMARKSGP